MSTGVWKLALTLVVDSHANSEDWYENEDGPCEAQHDLHRGIFLFSAASHVHVLSFCLF